MRRIRIAILIGSACCISLAAINAAADVFLDWMDYHTIATVKWAITGNISISRSITPNLTTYTYAGIQGLSGKANARALLVIDVRDTTSVACSLVTIEMHANTTPSSTYGGSCSSTLQINAFESKSVSTCVNGSNLHSFMTTWWGRIGENPIVLTHADIHAATPNIVAGNNSFAWTTYLTDDFTSINKNSCYITNYY